MDDRRDTIAAIATATGRAGVGVVRISGPAVPELIRAIIGRPLPPRAAALARFRDAAGEAIDQGIALYFRAPASYTGEDVLELQGHGGPVVLQLLLQRCLELGARVAAPGEFTQRAFLNDKLDLAQAESVADLIDASTAEAARCAMRSLQGAFSERITSLVRSVIEVRALVEATLDFPDEEIDLLDQRDLSGRLARVEDELGEVLAASRQGSLLREGLRIVLLGEPNVGKSSLLNRLAGEEVAIVTDIPGTTRDTIHQAISLGGLPVYLVDTAGLRASEDPVEKLGIARAWQASERADVALVMVDASAPHDRAEKAILERLPPQLPVVVALNKIDLLGTAPQIEAGPSLRVWISAKESLGLDLLRDALLAAVGWRGYGEGVFLARQRHLVALEEARSHVVGAAREGRALELVAERLRLAQLALCRIVGEFSPDDLLGEIFSRFCIGK
jgi:tRNA modification GTPase